MPTRKHNRLEDKARPLKARRKPQLNLKHLPDWLLMEHGRTMAAGVLVLGLLGAVGVLAYFLFSEPTVPAANGEARRLELNVPVIEEVEDWLDGVNRRRESGFETPRADLFGSS